MSDQGLSPEILRRERDYYIDYLKIVAYNGKEYSIASQMIEFTYHESIATPCVYCSVTLYDAVDFPTLLPMIGEERLKVSFTRQDEHAAKKEGGFKKPIVLDLPIYKISGRSPENTSRKGQVYTLHATSDEMLKSLKSKVRLGLKGLTYSEMVRKVYDEYVKASKDIEVEDTKHIHDFCISNMNPFRFITHVSGKSISPKYGGCLYFFYEDRNKFNYKSLGTMFEGEQSLELNFAVKNTLKQGGDKAGPKERVFDRDMYSVEALEHKGSFDLIKTIISGAYSQRAIFFDPVRQLISTKDFDIEDEWDSLPHIDKVKPFTSGNSAKSAPDSRITVHWTNSEHDTVEHIASKEPGINPFRPEDFTLRVNAQLDGMMRSSIDVIIPGTPDMIAGQVVQFHLPEHLGKVSEQEPEEPDAYLQGKYLVVSVMHRLSTTEYTCSATIVKDSFYSNIKHRDPEAEYPIEKIY
jgi:hypothetical protein